MSYHTCAKSDCKNLDKKSGTCKLGGGNYTKADGTCGSAEKILTASERALKAHETMWVRRGSPVTVHLALYCVDSNPVEMGRDAFACHSNPRHFGDRTVLPDLTGDIDDITCEKCKKSKLFAETKRCIDADEEMIQDMTPYEHKARKKEVQ